MALKDSEKTFERKIVLYPILLVLFISSSFIFLIYNYINTYEHNEQRSFEQTLINNSKQIAKNRILKVNKEIEFINNNIENNLKKDIKEKVYEAIEIIKKIQNKYSMSSDEEIKKLISIALLHNRFFNGRGYYFLYEEKTNKMLVHKLQNVINKKLDLNTLYNWSGFKKNQTETYLDIKLINPNSFIQSIKKERKTIFLKRIPELGLVIGTGEYIDILFEEKKQRLLKLLSKQNNENSGYFWVYDNTGKLLMNFQRPNSIGKNDLDFKDANGVKIVKKTYNAVLKSKNGLFLSYHINNPDTDKIEKKYSFVKYFPKWNWIIGTGVHMNNLNKLFKEKEIKLNQKIKNLYCDIFTIIIVIIVLTLLVTIFLSTTLKNLFTTYKNNYKYINEILEEKVKDRTKELNLLNNSLETKVIDEIEKNRNNEIKIMERSKLTQMGEMIGNIAHQWRQPLGVISIISSTLHMKLEHKIFNEEEAISKLETLNKNSKFLSDTIEQFSNFINDNSDITNIIVQERVQEVIDIIKDTLNYHNIELLNEMDMSNPIYKKLVLGELTQVVINILNNAKDALIINSNLKNKWIKVNLSSYNNIIKLDIQDNAGGIKNDILNKIFNPYFTTKEKRQGSGIGLYMSKNIIENNLQGKLYVQNTKYGAKFTIELNIDT